MVKTTLTMMNKFSRLLQAGDNPCPCYQHYGQLDFSSVQKDYMVNITGTGLYERDAVSCEAPKNADIAIQLMELVLC